LVQVHKDALTDWLLFRCPRPLNLNDEAPSYALKERSIVRREDMRAFFARGVGEVPGKYTCLDNPG